MKTFFSQLVETFRIPKSMRRRCSICLTKFTKYEHKACCVYCDEIVCSRCSDIINNQKSDKFLSATCNLCIVSKCIVGVDALSGKICYWRPVEFSRLQSPIGRTPPATYPVFPLQIRNSTRQTESPRESNQPRRKMYRPPHKEPFKCTCSASYLFVDDEGDDNIIRCPNCRKHDKKRRSIFKR